MGWWEAFEAEQAAIEAQRASFPAARDAVFAELRVAWPPQPLDPPHTGWADSYDEPVLREAARGKTWQEIPAQLLVREYALITLLTVDELVQVLPAWLRSALIDTDSNVLGWLCFRLDPEPSPRRTAALYDALSVAQRDAIRQFLDAMILRCAGRGFDDELRELRDTAWSGTPSFPYVQRTDAQQAIDAERRDRWPAARDAVLASLPIAFPPRPLPPLGDAELRADVRGQTWCDLSSGPIDYHRTQILELPAADFVELLPAWLGQTLKYARRDLDPLLGRIDPRHPDPIIISPAQRDAIASALDALAMYWAGRWRERELKAIFNLLGVR